ncbi:MAG: 2-succinyl-5-enolpyruvyl-6-hydroxy-3-cyclohexene-1-carboxylic-acid synthase [Dehalococcoidia bacterium]|nr:2-succinyl-5-enolpyruvyl-6-hydroxy-3-cyclohexene-1-carboxylic-acid synthase [Dehalococcoidia bacterium]
MMEFENPNYFFAGAFVEELARCGLKHACICPGSRSTPLTISFARQKEIKCWVHLDERSAGFFALGMSRCLGQPVALVCSSGTAAANFYPAIVEARYSRVPLLVLTADRPPELLDWGALQTIDQVRMFGSHVKWEANMPPPETLPHLNAFVRSTADRAYATAVGNPSGPVHVNFPFREPLEPTTVAAECSTDSAGRTGERPFLTSRQHVATPNTRDLHRLARELKPVERGLIICGPDSGDGIAEAVCALAGKLGYPVMADCLSQVRCGMHDRNMVIGNYDMIFQDEATCLSLVPNVILRFGRLPVSKPLTRYIERHRSAQHILVDGYSAWHDPLHVTAESWQVDPASFCQELARIVKPRLDRTAWGTRWLALSEATAGAISEELARLEGMFEGRVFSELAHILPEGSLLFAGNSMPIRDMDSFFPSLARRVNFMANRGASGIDGVVSSALGASAVAPGRLVAVIGDVSFYHDMNGLLAAKKFGLKSTIIVVNNDGGGIFSFMPQSACTDVFEDYFGTPHGLTFKAAAQLYGLEHSYVTDWPGFAAAVKASLEKDATTVIEVPGDRCSNVSLHHRVRDAVREGIRRTGDGQ